MATQKQPETEEIKFEKLEGKKFFAPAKTIRPSEKNRLRSLLLATVKGETVAKQLEAVSDLVEHIEDKHIVDPQGFLEFQENETNYPEKTIELIAAYINHLGE